MGEGKEERGRAIEEALETADERERLDDDSDLAREAERMDAAMKKAREEERAESLRGPVAAAFVVRRDAHRGRSTGTDVPGHPRMPPCGLAEQHGNAARRAGSWQVALCAEVAGRDVKRA